MLTREQVERAVFEANQAVVATVRYELDQQMRQSLVEWASSTGSNEFHMAVFSAVNGKWDDVRNDLRKGRITLEEASLIIDLFLECKLINRSQFVFYSQQFQAINQTTEQIIVADCKS